MEIKIMSLSLSLSNKSYTLDLKKETVHNKLNSKPLIEKK